MRAGKLYLSISAVSFVVGPALAGRPALWVYYRAARFEFGVGDRRFAYDHLGLCLVYDASVYPRPFPIYHGCSVGP